MSDFKWAHGQRANVKEPLPNLTENGWQYGDVPTASNFNWLFNQLQQELEKSKAETAELKKVLSALPQTLETLESNFEADIELLRKATETALRNSLGGTKNLLYGVVRLIAMLEDNISRYHPNFPEIPWPRDGGILPPRRERMIPPRTRELGDESATVVPDENP